jgi:hypothetical protein
VICPDPKVACDGVCIDASSDDGNCGACGKKCDTGNGFTCAASQCSCIGNLTDCYGQCVDTSSNANHCGDCDVACLPGHVCLNGQC